MWTKSQTFVGPQVSKQISLGGGICDHFTYSN